MRKGKLVVIEGSDGSGKTTQLTLLVDYCKANTISHATLDFPQYDKTFFGKWIGRFLNGDFGRVEDLPPYLLMFPYAADRWQAKGDIKKWLTEGRLVLSNRYTGSNAYQAAKLPNDERERFIQWSFEMEYGAFGIPREDLVIFLYVPFQVSQKLLDGRGAKDIHESHAKLMQEVENVYLEFCEKFAHWVKIDCTNNGEILTRQDIHKQILEVLMKEKILS